MYYLEYTPIVGLALYYYRHDIMKYVGKLMDNSKNYVLDSVIIDNDLEIKLNIDLKKNHVIIRNGSLYEMPNNKLLCNFIELVEFRYYFHDEFYIYKIHRMTEDLVFPPYNYEEILSNCSVQYINISDLVKSHSGPLCNFYNDKNYLITPSDMGLMELKLETIFGDKFEFTDKDNIIIE